MHVSSIVIILAAVLSHLLSLPVLAAECPSVTQPDELYEHDRLCLRKLDERFKSYTLDIRFLSDRNSLLNTFFYADQQLIIDTFYVKYCKLVGEPKWNLSADEQQARLDVAKEKLYTRVPFPPPVVDTRNLSSIQPLPKVYLASNFLTQEFLPQNFNTNSSANLVVAANQVGESATTAKYLRASPFLITKGNKYFVIVSSVKTYEGALSEVRRLKLKAPQFDFVAYAPYGDNAFYGIMMATWVRYSVAKEAVANAKKYVAGDSYIWKCPNEGDRC